LDWDALNAEVIAEFRSRGGKVARFGDNPVAILHTLGAKTNALRLTPLVVIMDGEDRLIFGTKAGDPQHPDWYFNVRAHPRIEVEMGTERFTADIVQLSDEEAQAKVDMQTKSVPQFAAYVESAAPRKIPVFKIVPVN